MWMIIYIVKHLALEEPLNKKLLMVIYVYLVMKNVNLALQQKLIVCHAFQILTFRMDHAWKLVVLDITLMIQI